MEFVLLGLRILAAILLYAFLGLLLSTLWRDLRITPTRSEMTKMTARLVVVETAESVLETGTAFVVQPVTSIGRGPGNTISVPDSYASVRHALLTWRGSQWWLEDQGSRNGTLLNGLPVTGSTVVTTGDIVRVGRCDFRLECDDGLGPRGQERPHCGG
jgi:pSer/pThr/pTyr-binding forkhead associated (FHA) protein